MIKSLYFSFALFLCISQVLAVDPPPGLRPAKAVGNEQALAGSGLERKVLPFVEATKNEPLPPANARIPPNLSLRSRMIAAQNSAASHDEPHEEQDSPVANQPVVFNKKSSKSKKASSSTPKPQIKKTVIIPAGTEVKVPRVTGPTPPKGNYGVNTVLQTNLVDSQGRVIKGVSSVPIPLPATGELGKKGQATASQTDNDEDRVVPVKFGRAGDN